MKKDIFIHTIQNNPDKALFYLYRKSGPIKKWICANSGTLQDAEDMMQEGLCILYENLVSKQKPLFTEPEHYFMGICRNLWWSKLRKQKKMHVVSMDISELNLEDLPVDELLPIDEIDPMVLLSQVGEKCQQLLSYFYFYKMSMEEIAIKLAFRNDKVAKAMKYKCLEKARTFIFKK